MLFEPVLLTAPLRAIFYRFRNAFRTLKKWNELLIKIFTVFILCITISVLLVLPEMLQWALIIITLANMNKIVIWRLRDKLFRWGTLLIFRSLLNKCLFLLLRNDSDAAGIHHC